MLQYTYEIQRPVANTPGNRRNLFGYEATLQQATEVQPEQTWPDKEHVILVQQLLLDTREEKKQVVEKVKAKIDGAKSVVILENRGLTVAQATLLRAKLREADVELKVLKMRS